jgi:hypothetical protein
LGSVAIIKAWAPAAGRQPKAGMDRRSADRRDWRKAVRLPAEECLLRVPGPTAPGYSTTGCSGSMSMLWEAMTMNPSTPAAIAASLRQWHRIVASGDLAALPALLHPDVVFRSPAAFKPYHGAPAVALILRTVFGVFSGFAYERQFATGDGLDIALEFRARVGDRQLKGIDLIRFDADGRIVDFEVMIRPASGLQALSEEMGRRLAAAMAGNA